MQKLLPVLSINSSRIPVDGVGGLGMVAVVGVMAAALPQARFLLLGAALGGLAIAALIILRRRDHPLSDVPGRGARTLFSNGDR
jgi:hypothetical protein